MPSRPVPPRPDLTKAVRIRQYGIHKFAEVIDGIRFTDLGDPAVLDLRTIRFLRPSLLVLLRAYFDLLLRGDSRLGLVPRAVFARQPVSRQASRYMQAMNLYGEIKPTEDDSLVEQQQHLPLQRLLPYTDTDEPASRLKRIILGQLPQGKDSSTLGSALGITLAELLENFARHSESGRVGWVCAQYYRGRTYREARPRPRTREDVIEIAIADTGIGVKESLCKVEEHRKWIEDGTNPCELATELGVTGKPGAHSGYGLYVAKRLCERNQGVFKLASGAHWFKSDAGRSENGILRNPWPGTFVALRLALQRDLDVNKIYDEMEPLEVIR